NSYISKNSGSEGTILSNILNGSLWEEILQSTKETTFPLFIYFDDFETCNPLGSHAGIYKVGAVYFTIASIPPEYISRLENIFLTLLFHSSERSEFGNKVIFNCLLEDLKYLEQNGLEIELNNQKLKIFFAVILIVGDNLGLNSVFGFVESFSANYFCRFCTSHKSVTKHQTQLYEFDERNRGDYECHLSNKTFGIKDICVWNELQYFHVYDNHSVDIMHDLFEGIHRYDMALFINYFIKHNFFSINTLNSRLRYFHFDNLENNYPPDIKQEHLDKGMIIFSAAEMSCFVKNFRFIIGDFVPHDDPVWALYKNLLEVTDFVLKPQISWTAVDHLKNIISKYLQSLVDLFPNNNLKPKHHFLLHYPSIIRKVGPLCKTSSFRFEAKHRELKKIANSVQTRKNIPLTIAKKCQMQFGCRCISETGLDDRTSLSKPTFQSVNYSDYEFENNFDINYYKNNFFEVKWYEKNGIKFNISHVIKISWKWLEKIKLWEL
ncbi:uncharacterized protein LOC111691352, partial [Anoplophora glabripennis]|uniref:uncharacterized protein LOC111691352 n=1 Tax=Anoplophora glabripennis TaxID=217634 RepID=UPI000C772FF3